MKRPLANGAVPTYGPAEYNAVLAEVLPRLKPKTVLYTINLANDLFEAGARERDTRHAVWDGWAVRKETAPAQVASFPGREWLFRDSHAFFAARGLWFKLEGSTEEGRVASEGGWRDIVGSSAEVAKQRAEVEKAEQGERAQRAAAIADVIKERSEVEKSVWQALEKTRDEYGEVGPSTLRAARANPGDIVRVDYGEGSEPIPVTMQQIAEAAAQRKNIEAKLRELHDDKSLGVIARQDALDERVRKLRAPIASALQRKSPLYAHLARAKQLCDENGAELVVVVLPVDVQVSAKEWDKYPGAQKVDLSQTRVLVDDVLDMADTLGARSVDAWPALAAAEPGAFLAGDLHMSPKGHAAVADAIARALAAPAKTKPPALPPGRSTVPTPEEWAAAKKPASGTAYYTEYAPRGCTVRGDPRVGSHHLQRRLRRQIWQHGRCARPQQPRLCEPHARPDRRSELHRAPLRKRARPPAVPLGPR